MGPPRTGFLNSDGCSEVYRLVEIGNLQGKEEHVDQKMVLTGSSVFHWSGAPVEFFGPLTDDLGGLDEWASLLQYGAVARTPGSTSV